MEFHGTDSWVRLVPNGVFYGTHNNKHVQFFRHKKIACVDEYSSSRYIQLKDDDGDVMVSIPKSYFAEFDDLYVQILHGWSTFWSPKKN